MFFFVSAYIYLIFAGENVPWWVYGAVVLLLVGGAYSTYKKVHRQIAEPAKLAAADEKSDDSVEVGEKK